MGQKRKMPTKNQIFLHWQNILGLDPIKDKDMCWGCGFNIPLLERCHIEDRWINKNDNVSNLIILCNTCHQIQESCCINEQGRKKFIQLLLDGSPFMQIRIQELMAKWESGIYDHCGIYDLTYQDYLKLKETNK